MPSSVNGMAEMRVYAFLNYCVEMHITLVHIDD